ncbi:BgTH12-04126 [Blumeria graminis f. sp. triticale]|jgi:hypothetical protein
MPY